VINNNVNAAPSHPAASQVTMKSRAVGAESGKKTKIGIFGTVDPNCDSIGYPSVTVVKNPEHGQISIEHGEDYPDFSQDNVRSKCDMKPLPSTLIYYTSENGFTGVDAISFEVITVEGQYVRYEYAIHVI
jgi:hypothetical protein